MVAFNILVRLADEDKKTETEPTVPIIFLIEGSSQTFDMHKFNPWLKQCV